jgi:hypothetical protein
MEAVGYPEALRRSSQCHLTDATSCQLELALRPLMPRIDQPDLFEGS